MRARVKIVLREKKENAGMVVPQMISVTTTTTTATISVPERRDIAITNNYMKGRKSNRNRPERGNTLHQHPEQAKVSIAKITPL